MNEVASKQVELDSYIAEIGERARAASREMMAATTAQKNAALNAMAQALLDAEEDIIRANKRDLLAAIDNNLDAALVDRLTLTPQRIDAMAEGIRQVAQLDDPVGSIDSLKPLPSGIQLGKMRVPIGVIGIIYESRPNVTADAAAIVLKSGNTCVLRGGKEAVNSNQAIAAALHKGIATTDLPTDAVIVLERIEREAVTSLISLPQYFDVIIPRGGKGLIERIANNARVPVIKHLDGNCHVYVHEAADLAMANTICENAKTRRYGVCNAAESILVDDVIATQFLPLLDHTLTSHDVEIRGCAHTQSIIPRAVKASEEDYYAEYLGPIVSVKIVRGVDDAIDHINQYGSHHTDAIITRDIAVANYFTRNVDSSSVMVNASTAFADGFEYGLGAEIGISTDKLHVRGPVGVEGLTTQKYVVFGNGETRSA